MANNIIDSAGAGISNESSITSSTKPGFTPVNKTTPATQVTEAKQPDIQNTDASNLNKPNINNIIKDVKQNNVTDKDSVEAAKVFKLLLNSQLQQFKPQDFTVGSMLFYRYDAKDKENVYDKSPLVIVLRKSRGYMLGLNVHWTPIPLRIILLKYILQMNKNNIRSNAPLHISYSVLKPLINQLNLGPVIRLYIFGRISRRGLVVPPSMWLSAAKLKSESFTNGQSAESLYKKALSTTKQWKQNRGRRTRIGK